MARDKKIEMQNDESDSDSGDDASTSSEEPEVELMVTNRSRRANAGNKMSSLVESSMAEDDFYKSAYGGGFNEDDADDMYESPVHSDVDEVDSDFDRPEEEDEPISDQEGEEKRPQRKSAYKDPHKRDLIRKNKNWALSRMAGAVVAANAVDAETQEQFLKEAEFTEKQNVESLQKYEQFELERKKKREKASARRCVPPPYFSFKSNPSGNCIVVPEIKKFDSTRPTPSMICAVTHRPAKYRDPVTGLPYASSFAFKVIRDKYNKFLKQQSSNPEVTSYLEQFEV